MRSRRALGRWLVVTAVALTVGSATVPAHADPVSDAGTTLHSGPLFVESGATVKGQPVQIDRSAVSSAFGSTVKVAVFKDGKSAADIDAAGKALTSQLGTAVLVVFSGSNFDTGSNLICGTGGLLKSAITAHSAQMSSGNYTETLVAFARAASRAPRQRNGSCGGSANGGSANNGSSNNASGSDSSGSTSVWPWIVGLGAVGAAAVGALSVRKRRRANRELSEAKAKVTPYYDRLANEVGSLNPGTDDAARQAVADASERYNSAGSQMASATTVPQWAAVRRTVLEGLQASQTARKLLKLPEGPEVPPVYEPTGEQLTAAQQVSVQGQQYTGYPAYTPGAPYYYGGGGGYMGGWYNYPFWETMLIGSMIGGGGWGYGGFGGFGGGGYGGGGYGAGYDQGYQAGERNDDNNSGDNSGGSWGGDGGFGGGGGGGWGGDGGFGDSGGGWGGGGGFGDGGGGGGFSDGGGGGGSDGGSF